MNHSPRREDEDHSRYQWILSLRNCLSLHFCPFLEGKRVSIVSTGELEPELLQPDNQSPTSSLSTRSALDLVLKPISDSLLGSGTSDRPQKRWWIRTENGKNVSKKEREWEWMRKKVCHQRQVTRRQSLTLDDHLSRELWAGFSAVGQTRVVSRVDSLDVANSNGGCEFTQC